MGLNYPRSKHMNLFEHNRTVPSANNILKPHMKNELVIAGADLRMSDLVCSPTVYVYIEHRNQTGSVFLRGIRLTL